MKKLITTITALTFALAIFTACATTTQTPQESSTANSSAESSTQSTEDNSEEDSYYPITITNYNYAGEEVKITFDKAPEKVMSVYQGSIETMIALGLQDHSLVSYGLDNEVKPEWQEGFEGMNYDESVFAPDKETATILKPDLILSWGSLFGDKNLGDVGEWHNKGTATYINTNTAKGQPRSLENEYTDIINIGKIFNVEDKAQGLVDEMKSEIENIVALTTNSEPVSVVVLEPSSDTIINYHKDTLGGDMVINLNGELAKQEGGTISKEELVVADPDVIFVVYMAYSEEDPETVKANQLSAILDDPALQSLSAIKNNRVHLIMLGDMYASGPRTLDGIKTLSEGMYPTA